MEDVPSGLPGWRSGVAVYLWGMPRIFIFVLGFWCSLSAVAQEAVPRLDTLVSPAQYLAVGNAPYEAGDFGRAILAYERGLRLQPGNDELANNLRFVREEAGITRPVVPENTLVRWWRAAGAGLGAGTCFVLAMACWWLAVAGALFWYLRREGMSEGRRFALLPVAGLLLGLAVLFYQLGSSRNATLARADEAVLIQQSAALRVAPGPEATLEATLSSGRKLRIVDRFERYVKVQTEDGRQGWLPQAAVEVI